MIVDGILNVLNFFMNILLSPLEVLNIAVDIGSSIPVVGQFLSIIAYIFPWKNMVPLLFITFAAIGFRISISLIKTLWSVIPGA